jgi:CHAD domain-containing protein
MRYGSTIGEPISRSVAYFGSAGTQLRVIWAPPGLCVHEGVLARTADRTNALHHLGAGGKQAGRILRKEVRKGLSQLDGGQRATDEDIHDARKRIKKARATLRLLRKSMSRAEYQREDDLLRDAAHPLSAARDAKILVEALDGLRQRYAVARRVKGVERFRRALLHARRDARHHALTDASGVRQSRKLMQKACARSKHRPLRHKGWRWLVKGALRRYTKGRCELRNVRSERSVERLHRWRKQAKYLYLQLELLAPICAPSVARLGQQLHSLSDDLGTDHDLAMLHDRVAAYMRDFPDEIDARPLLRTVERSRNKLQRRALLRGARLYSKRPATLARTLGL